MAKGIRERHARSCRSREGRRCTCDPSFEAQTWHPVEGRRIRRTFANQAEAKTWLSDAKVAVRRGRQVRVSAATLASRGADLAFGATPVSPFCPKGLQRHADAAWGPPGWSGSRRMNADIHSRRSR